MASSSITTTTGNSSASSSMMLMKLQNPGSELSIMDEKKRKRMVSNRDSARRSRMRKQTHVDDLMAKTGELRTETEHILASMNMTTQLYLNIEGENTILRAQMVELSQRLESLNEIVDYANYFNSLVQTEESQITMMMMNNNNPLFTTNYNDHHYNNNSNNNNNNSTTLYMNQQPIMGFSADLFMY